MNPQRYELKSPNDSSFLAFAIRERLEEETTFDVFLQTPQFSGVASSSTFMVQPLEDLFRDMAAQWMGWAGKKTWRDLESSVEIAATSDKTGHISLHITLNGQDGDTQLRTCLKFEAGQLEIFAKEVALLFA
jgi:hypothetical protein